MGIAGLGVDEKTAYRFTSSVVGWIRGIKMIEVSGVQIAQSSDLKLQNAREKSQRLQRHYEMRDAIARNGASCVSRYGIRRDWQSQIN